MELVTLLVWILISIVCLVSEGFFSQWIWHVRVCRVSESSLRVIKSRDVRGEPGRDKERLTLPPSVSNALCLLSNLVESRLTEPLVNRQELICKWIQNYSQLILFVIDIKNKNLVFYIKFYIS